MKRFVLALPLLLTGLFGQSVETIPFRAVLSNANEVPPAPTAASGTATVLVHVVRDASGRIVSGSVDAIASYRFPAAVTLTGMHIHRAPAGSNGSIVVPFDIPRTEDATGATPLPTFQTQFPSTAVTLETINGLIADPENFYFNIHSTVSPGGAIRGQLQRAELVVRIGIMKPENENPPITGTTYAGIGTTTALITRDASGKPTSALVIFDVAYNGFPENTTFTGLHIHLGTASVNGGVTINTGLRSEASATGVGTFHYEVEADVSQANVLATLDAFVNNPANAYINLHTSVFTGGAIRSQLLSTDRMDFDVTMLPSNEVPPITGLNASAPAKFSAFTARNADGTVAGGAVIFDVNPRFPAGTTFTGLHIHDNVAGQNGPVTIDSGLAASPILVADGTGNIFRIAQARTAAALNTLNSLVVNPERHYINLHTSANTGGATRAQLAAANTATPRVTFVETAVQDPALTTLAPGGLALVAGSNFTKVGTNIDGFNAATSYPNTLNGTSATIAGRAAPIVSVAGDRLFLQVPFDTPAGTQPLVVTNSNGSSTAFNVTIAAIAPAIFIYESGAVAIDSTDFTLIGPGNPARAGDTIIVYATGLGQTTPALQTGEIAGQRLYGVSGLTARIGGQTAQVIQAAAIPGFAGVYGVAIRVPTGIGTGNVPILLQSGTQTSNVSSIAVQ